MRPTTVLHVVESWPPVVSGYTSRGLALVQAQQRRADLDPAVLVSSRQQLYSQADLNVPPGLERRVHAVAVSSSERVRRRVRPWVVDGPALRRRVQGAAAELGADALHSHFSSTIGTAVANAARAAGLPLVAEVRFDLAGAAATQTLRYPLPRVEAGLRRWFERHLGQADAVVAASQSLAGLLEESLPALRGRVTVAPNGVDAVRFRPGPPDRGLLRQLGLVDRLVVGSTAKMLRYEGLDLLVHAAARLGRAHPELAVLLVGDGPERARLQALAEQLRAPVVFAGTVSAQEVPAYYRLFDVFGVPRRSVSVTRYAAPLKLLEALASGCAVVASPVGDIPGLLAEDRGVLLPAGDVPALAEGLGELLQRPERRAELGARARAWALQAGTWDATAAIDAAVYREVCAPGRRAG